MDIRASVDRLICIMFPPRCLNCNEVVCYEDMFCGKCDYKRADAESCRKKMRDVPVSGAIAGTLFSGNLRKAIWTIKEKQDVRVRAFFAETMLEEINANWPDIVFDYVTAVPISPEKLKKRGFNQAGFLAKELAKLMGVPHVDNALIKENDSQTQRTLNSRQRKENARKSFHIAEPELVKDKTILLVDDVLTTGATLRICAKLLLNNGAKAVYIAAASSTPDFAPSASIIDHKESDIGGTKTG